MPLIPIIQSPFSDAFWLIGPQYHTFRTDTLCAKIQMKYLDCLEAYGLRKGEEKCANLFYDLDECHRHTFQIKRAKAIRAERMKQYKAGKLEKPFDEHPPYDSYFYL